MAMLKSPVRRQAKTHRCGFTLIELLVVISIIALLISILLPALGKARKSSRAIVCGSIMKQIGTWVMTYAADCNGILPTHGDKNWSDSWGILDETTWATKAIPAGLYNGWGIDSPIKCPEAWTQVSPLRDPSFNFTYGINQYMGGRRNFGSGRIAPLPRLEIVNSKGYLFGEARATWYAAPKSHFDFHPVLALSNSATPSSSWPWCWPNPDIEASGHPERNGNFLYGDGHVNRVSAENFKSMTSNERKEFLYTFY
jgi:prepilin-type N-terminal cleavage/methylation domain-containing protein/prepilin-type processing-associated H-X9-DG protein